MGLEPTTRGFRVRARSVLGTEKLHLFPMLLKQEYSVDRTSPQLREPSFWVLTALAAGRNHGYALIQQAEELSDGRVSLKVPTLYAALDRLRDQGLVATDGDEVIGGRLRRYFCLTDDGASRLGAEIERMETNARQAKARLKLRATAKGATA